jgi:hypothetical protein
MVWKSLSRLKPNYNNQIKLVQIRDTHGIDFNFSDTLCWSIFTMNLQGP